MASIRGWCAAVLIGCAITCVAADHMCDHISTPSTDYKRNTQVIQTALDKAARRGASIAEEPSKPQGCVSITGGDYPVERLMVGSNTLLRLGEANLSHHDHDGDQKMFATTP